MILTSCPDSATQRLRARARQIHPAISLSSSASLCELLDRLPVLSKADLARVLPPEDQWLGRAVLFSETSGTTGQPLQTPRGACDLVWNAHNQAKAYRRFLQHRVDRVAILHPSVLSPFIEASSMALRELGIGQVRIYPIPRVCDYRRIFSVLERYQITAIMSTPSLVYKLFYEFTRIDPEWSLKHMSKLLLTGEELSLSGARNLKQILKKDALVAPFVYGSSEAATLMMGREDGMFDPLLEDFVFELKDDGRGDGKKLIVTWLREGLMPVLRYDTGDYFALSSKSSLPLRFLGRTGSSAATREFCANVEQALYSLNVPVFHYEGHYSELKRQLDLRVVLASSLVFETGLIEQALRDRLPLWQITVRVNPLSMDFFQFSPVLKIGKLVPC